MPRNKPAERFVRPVFPSYFGENLHAERTAGASTAVMKTFGRTNADYRQEVADKLASITETATVERIDRNTFTVHFATTHRILPIDPEAA